MSNRKFKLTVIKYLKEFADPNINFWISKSIRVHGIQFFLLSMWKKGTNKLNEGVFIEDCKSDFMRYSSIQIMRRR